MQLADTYEVKSNRESGLGRYDIMLIPKDKNMIGIIIEFKMATTPKKQTLKSAIEDAFNQIEKKQYEQEMLSVGVHNILKYAIAFSGKQCMVKSEGFKVDD